VNLEAFGGRRFVMAVLTLVSVDALRWFEHLDNGSFTAVLIASVCAYIAGDTFQRHSETRADVEKSVAKEKQ
jgi:hypothetical protein